MIERTLRQAADSFNARDYPRAEALCQRVLKRAPRNPEALHLLGILRLQSGRAAEAVSLLRGVLQADPRNVGALDALGAAFLAMGDFPRAEENIRRLIAEGGVSPILKMHLGIALASQGEWDEALRCFEEAVRGAPEHPDAHYNLGNVLLELTRPQEAVVCLNRTLALDPRHVKAHNALGSALRELGRVDDAIASYRRALALDPANAQAHHNLGNALLDQGQLDEAGACFERAIALKPDYVKAHSSLGVVRLGQGRVTDAMACQQRALALDAGAAQVQYNLALLRLFRMEFGQAWPGYERRLETVDFRKKNFRAAASLVLYERLPRWRGPGEAGVGEVAIWAEQGIGDQTLFSTLIPELIGAGVPFLYEVDRRLLGAYQRAFPSAGFVAREEPPHEALQQASRVLAIGSLPGLFRRSREDFARQPAKLLSALPERVAHYRGRLDALGRGLKVAFSWWSTRKDWWVLKKGAPLAHFTPLLKLPGVQFVDVQYGDTAAERSAAEAATGVRLWHFDEVDYFNDLEEVLAILEACDLLITTSNATAHFAGALGKRTWLLYPAARPPLFYWVPGADGRSLWYPSVEIVSAAQLTDWNSLIRHIAEKLASRVAGEPAAH